MSSDHAFELIFPAIESRDLGQASHGSKGGWVTSSIFLLKQKLDHVNYPVVKMRHKIILPNHKVLTGNPVVA